MGDFRMGTPTLLEKTYRFGAKYAIHSEITLAILVMAIRPKQGWLSQNYMDCTNYDVSDVYLSYICALISFEICTL